MLLDVIVVCVLILVNGFFSAIEIAFISLNDSVIKKQAEDGDKKAKKIEKLLKQPSKFLATIQIGITLAGFLSSAFAADIFADKLAPVLASFISLPESALRTIAVVLITLILSYFTLVFGELVPKRIAMKYSEQISSFSVGFIGFIAKISRPFVWLLTISTDFISGLLGVEKIENEKVTEEEIRMMIDVGEETGTIEPEEKEMINNVFEFNDKTVDEVMVPRIDVVAVDVEASIDEIIATIDSEKFSRVPVFEDTIDNIIGILNIKELLSFINTDKKFNVREIMAEPFYVPDTKKISDLFNEMRQQQYSIAIVVDEYGGTAGIISMEDILEEIVGNIFDEYDEIEEEYEMIDDDTYEMSGSIRLDDVSELLNVELPVDEYETLSGFIIGQLGRIPDDNESIKIEYKNLEFTVVETTEKHIEKVKVHKFEIPTKEIEGFDEEDNDAEED